MILCMSILTTLSTSSGRMMRRNTCTLMVVIINLVSTMSVVVLGQRNTLPGCPEMCGDVQIPYPFGIGTNFFRANMTLSCNETAPGIYKPFRNNVQIVNISLSSAQVRLYHQVSWQCYDHSSHSYRRSEWYLQFNTLPLRFSNVLNKFTTVGCDSLAYIVSDTMNGSRTYQSGCLSFCKDLDMVSDIGECSGNGCCQTWIQEGKSSYGVGFDSDFNNSRDYEFNPCTYAVLVEEEWFKFSKSYITTDVFNQTNRGRVPVILDWRVGDETCEKVDKNSPSYACKSDHSECVNSTNGPGYFCNCSAGYQGNPYLPNECQDINECVELDHSPCAEIAICSNTPGSFVCTCPPGTRGTPDAGGTCSRHSILSLVDKLVIGIFGSLFSLLVLGVSLYIAYERKKLKKIRDMYFYEHDGHQLLDELKSNQGLQFKIFTKEEIEDATDKFNKKNILGEGGQGIVYKGVLKDRRAVAIKISKLINEVQRKGFGQEMFILSQINHKNIVKILGCCLEVQVPILVYEFVRNGTLFSFIHKSGETQSIPLQTRLKIALESAEALAYLHSASSPPILHRDVKSSNILLDENYMAKVSDFGTSIVAPMDETELATLVQGTCGYLDPECIQTCNLTEKSDVYSFGVVILELLTHKKVIYFDAPEQQRSLAIIFQVVMKENRLWEILDDEIRNDGDMEHVMEIAELAEHCMKAKGEDRPTMKEVAEKLQWLTKYDKHPWVHKDAEEIQSLLGESSSVDYKCSFFTTVNVSSIEIVTGR